LLSLEFPWFYPQSTVFDGLVINNFQKMSKKQGILFFFDVKLNRDKITY